MHVVVRFNNDDNKSTDRDNQLSWSLSGSNGTERPLILVANNKIPWVPSNPTKISCFIGLYDSAVIVLLWVSLITASLSIAIFNSFLDLTHLQNSNVVITLHFRGEITVQESNEQPNRAICTSMLPREHEKDWVEFEEMTWGWGSADDFLAGSQVNKGEPPRGLTCSLDPLYFFSVVPY